MRFLQQLPISHWVRPTAVDGVLPTAEEAENRPWWKSGPMPIVVYKRSWRETFSDGGTKKEKRSKKERKLRKGKTCGKCRS